jgi:protein-S-isoprenylcysteine O-methyltransferase Ste14
MPGIGQGDRQFLDPYRTKAALAFPMDSGIIVATRNVLMATQEGISRIRKVAQTLLRIGMIALAVGAILFVCAVVSSSHPDLGRFAISLFPLGVGIIFYLGFLPLILGGILRLTAWIIEGFLLPDGTGTEEL